jgi:hypothetical protein
LDEKILARFWSKVDRGTPDECWEWTAGLDGRDGYGNFWLIGRSVKAHRFAWELGHGPIPIGLLLLHACDNRQCVNPKHLSLGTESDNLFDWYGRGRYRKRRPAKPRRPCIPETIESRFWAKVDERGPDECWEWKAGINRYGYGKFKAPHRREVTAHRMVWMLSHGREIPDGQCVLHRCDNRSCVNPAHLSLGTQLDNIRDRDRKGRHWAPSGAGHYMRISPHLIRRGDQTSPRMRPESRPRGEDHGIAKLTEARVRRIWTLHKRGWSLRRIGSELGVCAQSICNVLHGKTWAHVTPA